MTGHCRQSPTRRRRDGLSLLEVVISMAILLFSVVAISQLLSIGNDRAIDVQQQALGSMLCQRKLSELAIGAESMSSSGFTAFPEEGLEEWQWKVDANQNSASGLWDVQVTVKFEGGDGQAVEVQMGQMLLDPTLRGSSQDPPPTPSTANSSTAGSSASGSTTPSSGSSTPSASAPAASAPAASAPAASAPKTATPSTSGSKGN